MAGFADDASLERSNPVGSFIVVSHGVTIRCFRMQWMHYPWEWYGARRTRAIDRFN